MVLATECLNTKKAMKLKKAARITARPGESTRVETTVAMELAASWNPWVKSKIRAMATITATSANVESMKTSGLGALQFYLRVLCVLKNNRFKDIRYVLALVNRALHLGVQLFHLQDSNRISLLGEEFVNGFVMISIALVLQTVNGDAFFQHLLPIAFKRADGGLQTRHDPHQHIGHLARVFGRPLNAIKNDAPGGVFDSVDNVI